MIHLVVGGQASGKSAHALGLLAACPPPRRFVATGKAADTTFRAQIMAHKRERPVDLPLLEVDLELAPALLQASSQGAACLVDSLDYWLFACRTADQEAPVEALLELLPRCQAPVILVSAETGLGPVAADAATRAYVRALGSLNRRVAALAQRVTLVAAGLPLVLKGE